MNPRISKTAAFVATLCLLSAGTAFAQNQNGGPQGGRNGDHDWQKGPPSVEEKLARISNALGLDDEQSLQMLELLQNQEQQRAALYEQTMALMGEEICAQRSAHEQAVLDILTTEQAEQFVAIKQSRNERRQARENRRGGGGLDCPE